MAAVKAGLVAYQEVCEELVLALRELAHRHGLARPAEHLGDGLGVVSGGVARQSRLQRPFQQVSIAFKPPCLSALDAC